MATKFYYCPICGNVVVKMVDSGVTPHCCGYEMDCMVPGKTDGSSEKHVPVVTCLPGGMVHVEVGERPHPMLATHYIVMIALETDSGLYIKRLAYGYPATADFRIGREKPYMAYEYCNVHGLWECPIGCDAED